MSGLVNNSTIAVPLNTTVVFTNPQENDMVNTYNVYLLISSMLFLTILENWVWPMYDGTWSFDKSKRWEEMFSRFWVYFDCIVVWWGSAQWWYTWKVSFPYSEGQTCTCLYLTYWRIYNIATVFIRFKARFIYMQGLKYTPGSAAERMK